MKRHRTDGSNSRDTDDLALALVSMVFFVVRVVDVVVVFVVPFPLHRRHAETMHLGVPGGGTGVAPHVNPFPQFFSSFSLSLFFSSEKKFV